MSCRTHGVIDDIVGRLRNRPRRWSPSQREGRMAAGEIINGVVVSYIEDEVVKGCYRVSSNDDVCDALEMTYNPPTVNHLVFEFGYNGGLQAVVADVGDALEDWINSNRSRFREKARAELYRHLLGNFETFSGEYEGHS